MNIELLIFNHTKNQNENISVTSFEDLKKALSGIEYTVNGGLIFNNKLMSIRNFSSINDLGSILNLLFEEPDTSNAKLIVLYDLMQDFCLDFKSAVKYFNEHIYTKFTDLESFGRFHAENSNLHIPSEIEPYFDYEKYGQDHIFNFKRIDNYIFTNF
jgi:hypothetical protein